MFEPKTITLSLSEKNYTLTEPSVRVARRLTARILTIAPIMRECYTIVADIKNNGLTSDTEVALAMSPEQSATMFRLYDPICELVADAMPEVPKCDINNACDIELINAYKSIKEIVEGPLSRSARINRNYAQKRKDAIQQQNTSADNLADTILIGNHEPMS